MSEPTYKLEQFEGPLDLLLSLCQKNKVDITDIPIALICRQYLDYLAEAERMDMDVAGEFIVMASELMAIKAKMLLPRTGDDQEDPRKELADALLLLQQAKEAAAELKPLYEEYSGRMVKDNDEIPPENGFPLGLDTGLLTKALNVLLARFKSSEQPPQTGFDPLIKRRVVSVEEKIYDIMQIENVTKLTDAKVPEKKSGPSTLKNTAIGGAIGLLICAAIVVLQLFTDTKVKTEEEVKKIFDYPIIGSIPDFEIKDTEADEDVD